MRGSSLVLLLASVTACPGIRPGGAGASQCWPAGAFRIEALEHGTEWEPVFVVDAQGNVRRPGSSKIRGRFTHEPDADVLTLKDLVMRCTPDRNISFSAAGKTLKLAYDGGDGLAERHRVSIDASGAVHEDGAPPLIQARFVGDPSLRRAAVLLVYIGYGL